MILKKIKRRFVFFCVNCILPGTKHFRAKAALLRSIGWSIGEGTKIVGPLHNTGRLVIGSNCWIGANLTVHGNGQVSIGNNCDIAPDVTFLTGGHQIGTSERRAGLGASYEIQVGNATWIGTRATILGNTIIGNGAIVAACACVTKNVEENTLVGGVPAKRIRELT